jgi:hypothetical protein
MRNDRPPGRPRFSLSDFSRGELLVGGGSLVLLLSLFLPWMGVDGGLTVHAFHGAGFITILAWLGVVVLFIVRSPFFRNTLELPRLPWTDSVLFIIGGAAEVVGAVIFHHEYRGTGLDGFTRGTKFGLVLAIIGGLLTVAAGVLALRGGAPSLYTDTAAPAETGHQPPAAPPAPGGGAPPAPAAPPPPPAPPSSPPKPPSPSGQPTEPKGSPGAE